MLGRIFIILNCMAIFLWLGSRTAEYWQSHLAILNAAPCLCCVLTKGRPSFVIAGAQIVWCCQWSNLFLVYTPIFSKSLYVFGLKYTHEGTQCFTNRTFSPCSDDSCVHLGFGALCVCLCQRGQCQGYRSKGNSCQSCKRFSGRTWDRSRRDSARRGLLFFEIRHLWWCKLV